MGSGEYKQVPTRQDGPSRSYGTQRVAIERESNPTLQNLIVVKSVRHRMQYRCLTTRFEFSLISCLFSKRKIARISPLTLFIV